MSTHTSQTASARTTDPAGPRPRLAGRIYEGTRVYIGIGVMLVALVGYLAITQPTFATGQNLIAILETNSVLLLVAAVVLAVVKPF